MVQHLIRSRPPGRNDPCPCGSGKKYKKCCLVHEAALTTHRGLEDVVADLSVADETGDWNTAVDILEEARETLHNTDLDIMLIERCLRLPPADAEERLRRWWDQEHDRFSGAGLAQVLVDEERHSEALEVLGKSEGTDAWPEYWRLLGMLRDEEGKTESALVAMELYTRLTPDNAEAWMTLADMQQRLGHHNRALQALRRAGDALPDRLLPRMLRVRLLADEGRWREVRDQAETLLDERFEDSTPDSCCTLRSLLARAYSALGEMDAARTVWRELSQQCPGDRDVRFHLATLETKTHRHRQALLVLEDYPDAENELRVLEIRLRSLLALNEYEGAKLVAAQIECVDPGLRVLPLVKAAEAASTREYEWALEHLNEEPPQEYKNQWYNLLLDCLSHLGRWQDILPVLRKVHQPDEIILVNAILGSMAAGKLDLAERLLDEMQDPQNIAARSLAALLVPVRQSRRAAEVRRQQQVDAADKQRWTMESRDLRRRIRDLERHNDALAAALAGREAALERLMDMVGVSKNGGIPEDWESHLQQIADRAHKDAQLLDLQQAERRLRGMLGNECWEDLSESARAALREGEWLFVAVEGEDRDYGAALLEYARGLERAFKDAVFAPARDLWQSQPGSVDRLNDEGHDPSLGPFVRYLLQGGHLTLGSMAAALDRMGDVRRQGVAVTLLRRALHIDPWNERELLDWKRTADQLSMAAELRNQPAHAGAVNREGVYHFRNLVLGTDGLLRALRR